MGAYPLPSRDAPPRETISFHPARQAPTVSSAALARRRMAIAWTKRILPLGALALLTSLAVWPEFAYRSAQEERVLRATLRSLEGAGHMARLRYQSVDEKGRPYTITAATAAQTSPDRIDMTAPVGDILMQNGVWLRAEAKRGVYLRQEGQLDLAGDVWLFRDDGTTMRSETATIDLKSGGAAGADPVSAEGPFGTLDAMGFASVDKGSVVQFTGPARLVLNAKP